MVSLDKLLGKYCYLAWTTSDSAGQKSAVSSLNQYLLTNTPIFQISSSHIFFCIVTPFFAPMCHFTTWMPHMFEVHWGFEEKKTYPRKDHNLSDVTGSNSHLWKIFH